MWYLLHWSNRDCWEDVGCDFGKSFWLKKFQNCSNCWILINLNDKSEWVDLSGLYLIICLIRHNWINCSDVVQGKYVKTISLIERHKTVSLESIDDVVLYDFISLSWKIIDRQYELFDLHSLGDDEILLSDWHLSFMTWCSLSTNIETSLKIKCHQNITMNK